MEGEQRRVVVIDDDVVVLEQMRSLCTTLGYEVVTTTNPVGCARYLREGTWVLIDYHMPGIDGGFVLRSLKAAVRHHRLDCRFYLFTSDRDLMEQSLVLGFDGAIDKAGHALLEDSVPTRRGGTSELAG